MFAKKRCGQNELDVPKYSMSKCLSLAGLCSPSLGSFAYSSHKVNFTSVRDTFGGKATLSLIFKWVKTRDHYQKRPLEGFIFKIYNCHHTFLEFRAHPSTCAIILIS